MKRINVTSQMIQSIGYDKVNETLEVEFASNHSVYEYLNVPEYVYNEFLKDKSKGKYFLERIKPSYEAKKIR